MGLFLDFFGVPNLGPNNAPIKSEFVFWNGFSDLMFCHEFARQSFSLRVSVTSAHNDLEFVGEEKRLFI